MAISLTLPVVGGDNGAWGTELNTALNALNNSTLFARKTADETVSASVTLQDDDHLVLNLGVGTYTIEAVLVAGSAGTDIKVAWAFSGTATGIRSSAGPTVQTTSVVSTTAATTVGVNRMAKAASITSPIDYGIDASGTNDSMIIEKGVLVVTVAGTFKIQWAQSTATVTTTLRANSYILAQQVA